MTQLFLEARHRCFPLRADAGGGLRLQAAAATVHDGW